MSSRLSLMTTDSIKAFEGWMGDVNNLSRTIIKDLEFYCLEKNESFNPEIVEQDRINFDITFPDWESAKKDVDLETQFIVVTFEFVEDEMQIQDLIVVRLLEDFLKEEGMIVINEWVKQKELMN